MALPDFRILAGGLGLRLEFRLRLAVGAGEGALEAGLRVLVNLGTCVCGVHGLEDGGEDGVGLLVDGIARKRELVQQLAGLERVGDDALLDVVGQH